MDGSTVLDTKLFSCVLHMHFTSVTLIITLLAGLSAAAPLRVDNTFVSRDVMRDARGVLMRRGNSPSRLSGSRTSSNSGQHHDSDEQDHWHNPPPAPANSIYTSSTRGSSRTLAVDQSSSSNLATSDYVSSIPGSSRTLVDGSRPPRPPSFRDAPFRLGALRVTNPDPSTRSFDSTN
ncbi:hypothetical protein AMATHDRAFT_60315 [Amanita thiersii Skay4041]|uniref:Uncharacterized protein n=1 Tax=Amanita thiersii Skay4041 TaxID=703135 RepID=A0A2A9NST5_9AGAR|nr:hypothetical protein AMATHDRAFT_60315 [Amanita thiersii Skay4041]